MRLHKCIYLIFIICTLFIQQLHSELITLPFIFENETAENFLSIDQKCAASEEQSPIMDAKVMPSSSLVEVEGEPSAIIQGCVNAISGGYCETSVDFVIHHGVNPFPVTRTWMGSAMIGSKLHSGWKFSLGGDATYFKTKRLEDNEKVYLLAAHQEQGGLLYYTLPTVKDKHKNPFIVDKASLDQGITNTAQGYSSGQTNVRNRKFLMYSNNTLSERIGDGEERIYEEKTSIFYLRMKDKLPSGNSITYQYETYHKEDFVQSVSFLNPKGETWGGISIKGAKKAFKDQSFYIHTLFMEANNSYTSLGADYWLKKNEYDKERLILDTVKPAESPEVKYEYHFSEHPISKKGELITENANIIKKILPEGRYLSFDYYRYGNNDLFVTNEVPIHDGNSPHINRVKRVWAPAGGGNTHIPIYFFSYALNIEFDKKDEYKRTVKNGVTTVWDAYHRKTTYEFSPEHRLTSIKKFLDNGSLYTNENFVWGDKLSKNNTYLLSRSFQGPDGTTYFTRSYSYDEFGNTIEDKFQGTLTGLQNTSGSPEEYVKTFRYSKDGFNVPLEERDSMGSRTIYVYAPNTNRLIEKYQGDLIKWYRRWFYKYNEDGAIQEEISDDGSSTDQYNMQDVTQRKIVRYQLRKKAPVAYPDVIEEFYVDVPYNKEILNKRVVNTYNNTGRITKQDHYGSDGNHAYTVSWVYDEHGNILKEIDAIGRCVERKYDANDNCIWECGPRDDCYKEYFYDAMNRKVREDEVHSDGIRRTTLHSYDHVSNRVATVDPNGNTTHFVYNELGKLIQTTGAPIIDEKNNVVSPVSKQCYNPMGCVTAFIDSKNNITQATYNIRGQPLVISYSDGSKERLYYNLDGTLKHKIAKNNTSTSYTYDNLKRVTLIEQGPHKKLHTIYRGFNVASEKDAKGVQTTYKYFPNGLVKEKRTENKVTSFLYDSLGRVIETRETSQDDLSISQIHKCTYDLANRITKEELCAGNGEVQTCTEYEYDVSDHITCLTVYSQQGVCKTRTTYDSHGTPTTITDPLGLVTKTVCKYDYKNSLGQIVAHKTITDPEGNMTITIHDAHGHVVSIVKKNPMGSITEQTTHVYDACGNCCRIVDHVANGAANKQIITQMEYDTMGRVTTLYQAFGTPEQKVTALSYNNSGSKEKITKFDGTVIHHSYDAYERVNRIFSSDTTIDYAYEYDLNDNVVCTQDLINQTSTRKKYDAHNYLTEEILGNGQQLTYKSDHQGRFTYIGLSDGSSIKYLYIGSRLTHIQRYDSNNTLRYKHSYTSYDKTGKVLEASMANNCGKMQFTYDKCGRLTKVQSPNWSQSIDLFDKAGNIRAKTTSINGEKESYKYTYDSLYQLINEEGPNTHTYTYDSHYNRRTKDGRQCVYNSLDQLSDDGQNTYSYDLNGNLTQKNFDIQYSYDAYDRLVMVSQGNQQLKYIYDENHRRLSKVVVDVLTGREIEKIHYLYQGQNDIGTVDEEGNIVELRVLGIGKGAEIGAAISMELYGTLYVPIHDHQGNVASILNGTTGELVESYSYTAFGELLGDTTETLSPWLFSSKRFDAETGFVYYGRRYYDPATARWITEDPLGREAGVNRYAFVHNNPLTRIDLYGLMGYNTDYVDRFMRSMDRFVNGMTGLFKTTARWTGETVESIGFNLLPVPYVKDSVCFAGWCLSGQNPTEYVPTWKRPHSQFLVFYGYGDHNPNERHIYFNGMLTSKEQCIQTMANISAALGGKDVYAVYNSSQGFAMDLIETMFQKIGIPTHSQEVAEGAARYLTNDMDSHGIGTDGVLQVYAHSQGAQIVDGLSESMRFRSDVVAFGPAKVLEPNRYHSAQNHVSKADFIPWVADPAGCAKGISAGYVTMHKPHGINPLENHGIEKPVYWGIIEQRGFHYTTKYGSVEDLGVQYQ